MKYTPESITEAMMEDVCQGQEGHKPASFDTIPCADVDYIGFKCSKCKQTIAIAKLTLDPLRSADNEDVGQAYQRWRAERQLFGDNTIDWEEYLRDPKPTPPYP